MNLHVADCIDPASPLGGAVGLKSVGGHCALELIEVDENEGAFGDKVTTCQINVDDRSQRLHSSDYCHRRGQRSFQ